MPNPSPSARKASPKQPVRPPANQGPRVGITLTPEMDAVLTRLSVAASTGKATIIREWLEGVLPQLDQIATAIELAKAGNLDAFKVMESTLRNTMAQGEQTRLGLRRTRRAMKFKVPPVLRK